MSGELRFVSCSLIVMSCEVRTIVGNSVFDLMALPLLFHFTSDAMNYILTQSVLITKFSRSWVLQLMMVIQPEKLIAIKKSLPEIVKIQHSRIYIRDLNQCPSFIGSTTKSSELYQQFYLITIFSI